ncbi:hypothetical protein [Natrialba sp. PRR66]|uniref:hypothetical protein n=1 Tax=Natrialba sp. PRR66 TaxID=3098146 RepID=UPI002B1CED90|nr:hypothetical protein [Natrialba sp. PRR66]
MGNSSTADHGPDHPDHPDRTTATGKRGSRIGRTASVSRREFIAAVGGVGAVSIVGTSGGGDAPDTETLRIRVSPGPIPPPVWFRYGISGLRRDWPVPFRECFAAIEDAMAQLQTYAVSNSDRIDADFDIRVERGQSVRFPLLATPRPSELVLPSLATVLDVFREQLRDRGELGGPACHVLFCWSPLNYRVGYGGTMSPNDLVGATGSNGTAADGAQTVANIGATEVWDSRAISRNIAIHEVFHTLLPPELVEAVGGTDCDHDLGAATRVQTGGDDQALRVTPMATAYAGPDELGGGTRFHGTGCYDHDEFTRHDGYEGVDRFEYTTRMSEATLAVATRYLERIRERRRA